MAPRRAEPAPEGEHEDEILRQLRLGTSAERLAAARLLRDIATSTEVVPLQTIRRRELDHYVQQAIEDAIAAARERQPRSPSHRQSSDDHLDEPPWDDDAYAAALRAATTSFGHELRRPLGLALLAVDRADLGSVKAYLERMQRLLNAMDELVNLTDVGESEDFDLHDVLAKLVGEHRERFEVPIELLVDVQRPIRQSRAAVELIVVNALTNACESVLAKADAEPRPIVVTCGVTDREVWVGILDHGVGLPAGFDPFTFASTRKEGHVGVGLALARRAARSMNAEITITERDDGGATFRLEFPPEVA
jgi:signal transduction histidine kinase